MKSNIIHPLYSPSIEQYKQFAEFLLSDRPRLNHEKLGKNQFVALAGFLADDFDCRIKNFYDGFKSLEVSECFGVILDDSIVDSNRYYKFIPTKENLGEFENLPAIMHDTALVSDKMSCVIYYSDEVYIVLSARGVVERFLGVENFNEAVARFDYVAKNGHFQNARSQNYLKVVRDSCFANDIEQ